MYNSSSYRSDQLTDIPYIRDRCQVSDGSAGFDLPGVILVRMGPGDVAFQTLPQARASGKFDEAFIQQRINQFAQYRAKGLA